MCVNCYIEFMVRHCQILRNIEIYKIIKLGRLTSLVNQYPDPLVRSMLIIESMLKEEVGQPVYSE